MGINGEEMAQEQLIKQRLAQNNDSDKNPNPDIPELPSEVFETSGGIDLQETESYIMNEGISIPVIITPEVYEINSAVDSVTPPPPFTP